MRRCHAAGHGHGSVRAEASCVAVTRAAPESARQLRRAPIICAPVTMPQPDGDDEHHRGLCLVATLTTTWQAHPRSQGGKTVTFTVPAHHHSTPG